MKKTYLNIKAAIMMCLMAVLALNANAQRTTWDFSEGADETDIANLAADATNWTYESANNRYLSVQSYNAEQLTANGVVLNYTSELLFTTTKPDAVRIDLKKNCMTLNQKSTVTIKNVKAGSVITVECKSSSSTAARGLNVTNVTPTSGSFNATSVDKQTNVGTIDADGDVTLSNTGGLYVYSITISEAGSTDPSTPSATTYNSVPRNTDKNQVRLTLADGSLKYYNTDAVSVAIDKASGNVTVTPTNGSWSDVYSQTVSTINFAKKEASSSDGTVDNQAGQIEITEAKGWLESAYIKWNLYSGASSYNVYVKGGQYSDYTKIDYQLVRNYGTYGRADVVGLKKDQTYAIKVVAVDANKSEIAASANEATGIAVKGYDRAGFAHKDNNAPGAYNNDGTLKSNAVVVYITSDNVNTVELALDRGSKSLETITGLGNILAAFEKCDGNETRPFAFRFIGNVTGATGLSSEKALMIKGKGGESNVTFEGIGDDATLQAGLCINKSKNVEIRNLGIMLFGDDAIQLKTGYNAWVHNNDIFYGNVGGDADQAKGDGSLDSKDKGTLNTFSYNHFWDSGKSSLCGMKSESNDCLECYHHNWFDHSDSRHPRVRTKSVHVWNNYYDGCSKYGVGATMGSSVFVEANYYRHTKHPMLISQQGHDGGTFSGEEGGIIKSFGNEYAEASGNNYAVTTYQENSTSFDCYEATSRNEQVSSSVVSKVGSNTYNNFDTNSSLMYEYTADAAADVPSVVTGYYGAGRMNHGDFQWSFDNSIEDTNYDVITALKSALQSYKSSFVGFFESGSSSSTTTDPSTPSEPSDTTSTDTPSVEGTVLCSFDKSGNPSSSLVTCSSNSVKKGATVTVDGTTYDYCIKVDSKQTITVTVDKAVTMTIYFGNATATTFKVDGTKLDVADQQLTTSLAAGSHTLTKGDGEAAIGLIKLVPAE